MMVQAEEWKIQKRGRGCSLCGRRFRPGEEHYSGIVEADGRFERRDVCSDCWKGRPEFFSFWKTRRPDRSERKLEDVAAMVEFFKKLMSEASPEPQRRKITFLTALLLARKRRIKILGSHGGALRIEKSWDGETTEIAEPLITEEELEDLRRQMERLFEMEIVRTDLDGGAAAGTAPDGQAPPVPDGQPRAAGESTA